MHRFFSALLLAGSLMTACLISGCQGAEPPATFSRTIVALGTLVTVEIDGAAAERAEPALDQVEAFLYQIQKDWYAFGQGELGRVNQALAQGRPALMSERLAGLTRRSLALCELSAGFFDPTIGMLVESWGFGDAQNSPDAPPDEAVILRWLSQKSTRPRLAADGRTISADRPMKLTFGAMAKGTVLNEAISMLEQSGIANAIVEAGGDLKVLGQRGGRHWRIGIRDPRSPGILGTVELESGEAIVSSGDYERFFEYGGQRYHHLLDPRTGRPVTETAGVTVLNPDAELADAAATALMVAGPQRFQETAERMGISDAMLVGADGDIIMTPGLAARIREPAPSQGPQARIM